MCKWNKLVIALFTAIICLILILGPGSGRTGAEPSAPQMTQELAPAIMIALPWDDPTIRIPPPQQFRAGRAPKTATFSINYLSAGTIQSSYTCQTWSTAARAAFDYAASIWAAQITSAVPIRINACWADMGSTSILGSSGSSTVRDFPGAPRSGTYYSYSLADAFAGYDLDPTNPDSRITYNSTFAWYLGTDGNTPAGQYDFVSVVLHEMGHSLNFAGSARGGVYCSSSSYGCWGDASYPNIYDTFVKNGSGQTLFGNALYPNQSAALLGQFTGGNLYFTGTNAKAANGGGDVKIYAPSSWVQGSSYSHLDYTTFAGTANRLMVYAISSASSIHDPGPVTMGLLKDLGWTTGGPTPGTNKVYLPLIQKP
jgi:hypothetical protein